MAQLCSIMCESGWHFVVSSGNCEHHLGLVDVPHKITLFRSERSALRVYQSIIEKMLVKFISFAQERLPDLILAMLTTRPEVWSHLAVAPPTSLV